MAEVGLNFIQDALWYIILNLIVVLMIKFAEEMLWCYWYDEGFLYGAYFQSLFSNLNKVISLKEKYNNPLTSFMVAKNLPSFYKKKKKKSSLFLIKETFKWLTGEKKIKLLGCWLFLKKEKDFSQCLSLFILWRLLAYPSTNNKYRVCGYAGLRLIIGKA